MQNARKWGGVREGERTPPIFAPYQPGMRYGAHVDSPVLGGGRPLRSDLSVTFFLSDATDHEGGELAIETHGGQCVRLCHPGGAPGLRGEQ